MQICRSLHSCITARQSACAGNLYYRGYNIKDLVGGFLQDGYFGFEEVAYLLLFGELPDKEESAKFHQTLVDRRTAIVEYVSVPEDVTTCVVKVELLPPP